MTLRNIFNGIIDFLSQFFNAIIDFDLTNIFIGVFILGFLIFYPWLIYKATIDMKQNFKKWTILKKIMWPFLIVIIVLTYILPITLYLMD